MNRLLDFISNQILDQSVLFSFDQVGFRRHERSFRPRDLDVHLNGQVCLITGASSGIGFETALGLARLGGSIVLLCRNQKKGLEAVKKIQDELPNANLELQGVDIADGQSIHEFVKRWGDRPIDRLIHNAGVLVSNRVETRDGIELTAATNLIGPFLLTRLLLPSLKKSVQARVIFVASGGMYLKKLSLKELAGQKCFFNGVSAYANTKRAETIIAEIFANKKADRKILFYSMHPGWVDTPGVEKSLPIFWRMTRYHLRTPRQGADTLIWLCGCDRIKSQSGTFWFDRKKASTHAFKWTRESRSDRKQLWNFCSQMIEKMVPSLK